MDILRLSVRTDERQELREWKKGKRGQDGWDWTRKSWGRRCCLVHTILQRIQRI